MWPAGPPAGVRYIKSTGPLVEAPGARCKKKAVGMAGIWHGSNGSMRDMGMQLSSLSPSTMQETASTAVLSQASAGM